MNANSALTGNGAVGNTTINANGIFAPGDGTTGSSMTVASLALASGAQYMVQINPTTSTFANVTGTATLGGATVNATLRGRAPMSRSNTPSSTRPAVVSGIVRSVVNTNLPSGFHTSA